MNAFELAVCRDRNASRFLKNENSARIPTPTRGRKCPR